MSSYNDYLRNYDWFNKNAITKNIIDTVGIKGNLLPISKYNIDKYRLMKIECTELDKYKVMGIEAKASYQDFLNGFCCHCEYTCIIAPVGVIPVDKVPPKIGLIEVNLGNYKINRSFGKFEFEGINITKKCLSRKRELYNDKDIYNVDVFNMLKKITYRNTVHNLFKNNEIKIKGL